MWVRASPAIVVLWFAAAACDGDIGTGGGTPGSSVASTRPTPAGPAQTSCDSIAVCEGDTENANSGCIECAVLGNDALAADGGACLDEYIGCFGPSGACEEGGHPSCCAFFDCLVACPDDNPATSKDEFLDCVCDNDGSDCTVEQDKETCLGQDPTGGQRYVAWVSCLYLDVCTVSCAM